MRIRSFAIGRRNRRESPWWGRAALALIALMIAAFAVVAIRNVRRHDALTRWRPAIRRGQNGHRLGRRCLSRAHGAIGRLRICAASMRMRRPMGSCWLKYRASVDVPQKDIGAC